MATVTIWYESGSSFELSRRDAEVELSQAEAAFGIGFKKRPQDVSAFEGGLKLHRPSSSQPRAE
jgi:hypothetical protein